MFRLPSNDVRLVTCLVIVLVAKRAAADDWPRFRGPNVDGICSETGLLPSWPEGGPKKLWEIKNLGRGWSNISFAGGRMFTMGDRKAEGNTTRQYVLALDEATQQELWATPIGPGHSDGPRCTPTVDGDLLYALGTDGDLVCLETATGKLQWAKNYIRDFGSENIPWKFSESPLVDGEKLVCTPGSHDAMMVALNKKTGEVIWKCPMPNLGPKGKDRAGYASMVVAEIDGVRQYVQNTGRGIVGVEASSGKFLWGYNRIAGASAEIPTPVVRGNYVFAANGYDTGSAVLKVTRQGDRFNVEEVCFLGPKQFQNHHGGFVLVGDYIYGGHGHNAGALTCIEFLTGKIMWQAEPLGKGSASVLYADGKLYVRYENALVALVDASPKGLQIKGTFKTPTERMPNRTHPVIHDGKLYLRAHDVLMCFDIRQP